MNIGRTGAFVTALVLAVLILSVPRASAHAVLESSSPEPGSRVSVSPKRIQMLFNEPLNRELSSAALLRQNERGIPAARVDVDERSIAITLPARLGRGAYRVRWRAISTLDGHPVEGSFSFGVRAPPLGSAQSIESNPLRQNGLVRIAARAALYVGLIVFAGGLLVAALWMPRRRDDESPTVTLPASLTGRTAQIAGAAALAGALLVLLLDMANAAGELSASTIRAYVGESIAGKARLATAVSVAVALAAIRVRLNWIAISALLIAMWAIALSGHANSASPRAVALLTDWLHLVAGSIWVGGMFHIALHARRELRRVDVRSRANVRPVIERFGDLAVPAFFATVITGLYNMAIELGTLSALWETGYGRVLTAKILLVGLLALASFLHSRVLRPVDDETEPSGGSRRAVYWRLVTNEHYVATGAVVLAAVLAIFPLPPRQAEAASPSPTVADCKPCSPAGLREVSFAEQAGSTLVAVWLRYEGDVVAGTIRTLDRGGRPVHRSPSLSAGTIVRECGVGCAEFTSRPSNGEIEGRIVEQGEKIAFRFPAQWRTDAEPAARSLIRRSQATMRSTRTMRVRERIASDVARVSVTDFRLRYPDRLQFTGRNGAAGVIVGRRRWNRSNSEAPWAGPAVDSVRFKTADSFNWTASAREAWLVKRDRGSGSVVVAFYDRREPVWYRLKINPRSGRVTEESMVSPGHFMFTRYFDFNSAIAVQPPARAAVIPNDD